MRSLQLSILRVVFAGVCRGLSFMWLAALGLLLLIPSRLNAQKLNIADSVQGVLISFAADSIEHLVCLDGRVNGDTVFIDNMRIPAQEQSATGVVRRGTSVGCGATLAVWHNHPVSNGEAPAANLYFSLSDQNTFLRFESAGYAIVGVKGAFCLWTRDQVHAGWLLHLVPLPAIEAQCWRTDRQ